MSNNPGFRGGRNIAMKVPAHQYEATLTFYRDTLGLTEITEHPPAVGFKFGDLNLWIDNMPEFSQAEIWLEVNADDMAAAETALEAQGVVRCDEVEKLPEDFEGFWISSPASIVHLVCANDESPA